MFKYYLQLLYYKFLLKTNSINLICIKREQFPCTMVTSTGMVGWRVELNLSSSGKYALALGQFSSEVGAFHWPQKPLFSRYWPYIV